MADGAGIVRKRRRDRTARFLSRSGEPLYVAPDGAVAPGLHRSNELQDEEVSESEHGDSGRFTSDGAGEYDNGGYTDSDLSNLLERNQEVAAEDLDTSPHLSGPGRSTSAVRHDSEARRAPRITTAPEDDSEDSESVPPPAAVVVQAAVRRRRRGYRSGNESALIDRLGPVGETLDGILDPLLPAEDDVEALEVEANAPQLADDELDEVEGVAALAEDAAGGGIDSESDHERHIQVDMLAAAASGPAPPGPQAPPALARPARVDKPDSFKLFGDIPPTIDETVRQNFVAFQLASWAKKWAVPMAGITALLMLLRGYLGQFLGIDTNLFSRRRGVQIPETAKTLYEHAFKVNKAMGLRLLEPGTVPLPNDDNIKGRWRERHVQVYVAPDLRKNIALPLLIADLNNRDTPAYYDPATKLPDGIVSACSWLCEKETADRNACLARADVTEAVRQYPGMRAEDVGRIAVGVNPFIDSAQAFDNQSHPVTGFLVRCTNLHPSVREQPKGIALCGTWIEPGVLSAAKVAEEDVSANASKATLDRAAMVNDDIIMKVVVDPLRKLFSGPPLIVRAKLLRNLPPDYPHQYVALFFYLALINADEPMIAELTGHKQHQCAFDGCKGADLSDIPETNEDGTMFVLPEQFTTADVAQRYHRASLQRGTQVEIAAARTWLDIRGFNKRAPPALLFSMYHHHVPGAMDIMERITYDHLHCFGIGILKYFLDAIILIILNSHSANQAGYEAIGSFEGRISAIPSFNTGYRLFRCYLGGCIRRAIASGNDNFFLVLMFVAAIGLDETVIPDQAERALTLSAIETACVLSFLLRAEAFSKEGRRLLFTTTLDFLRLLKHDFIRKRQKSEWALIKFHLLLHLVNWVVSGRGAPACTNSSCFEAALKLFVTSIASSASGHQDVQRDIANNALYLAISDLLRSAGGLAGALLEGAAGKPSKSDRGLNSNRQGLNTAGKSRESFAKRVAPDQQVLVAVQDAWAATPTRVEALSRAEWYLWSRLWRPELRFAAPVGIGATVVLKRLMAAPDPTADDPAKVSMGRVMAYFYVPPPPPGMPDDGLPAPPAAPAVPMPVPQTAGVSGGGLGGVHDMKTPRTTVVAERMFVVVWPFDGQTPADEAKLKRNGLRYHAIRRPAPRGGFGAAASAAAGPGRLPLRVLPLAHVLRAIRAFPAEWTALPVLQASIRRYGSTQAEAVNAHRREVAACRENDHAALIFWPPLRDTFLPSNLAPPPACPEGANERREDGEAGAPDGGVGEEEVDGDLDDAANI